MSKEKKNREAQALESSLPVGVYPELDRDLDRSSADSVRAVNLMGGALGTPGTGFPLGLAPMFDGDLFRDIDGAADPDSLRTDPRLR